MSSLKRNALGTGFKPLVSGFFFFFRKHLNVSVCDSQTKPLWVLKLFKWQLHVVDPNFSRQNHKKLLANVPGSWIFLLTFTTWKAPQHWTYKAFKAESLDVSSRVTFTYQRFLIVIQNTPVAGMDQIHAIDHTVAPCWLCSPLSLILSHELQTQFSSRHCSTLAMVTPQRRWHPHLMHFSATTWKRNLSRIHRRFSEEVPYHREQKAEICQISCTTKIHGWTISLYNKWTHVHRQIRCVYIININ